MKLSKSYLPFKKRHIIAIDEISPERLKNLAREISKDKEDIKHTTILNFIAKSLGIGKGFSEYSKTYEQEMLPFMEKHGLKNHVDLFKPRNVGYTCITFKISKQSLSERLFNSGLSLPERVFTGYDFDYENTISDGCFYFNSKVEISFERQCEFQHLVKTQTLPDDFKLTSSHFELMPGESNLAIAHNIEIARNSVDTIVLGSGDYGNRLLKDFVLGGYDSAIKAGFNLIGDDLVYPRMQGSVIEVYDNDMESKDFKDSLKSDCLVMGLFRDRISESDIGWVNIIPFNDKLIFLQGSDGQFDIVFKNLKDTSFKHKFMNGELKIIDIPYFIEDYSFFSWLYFEYQGCIDVDTHLSEVSFYSSNGRMSNYPGADEILISYYKNNKKYIERKKSISFVDSRFVNVNVLNKSVCVSNLVSISDFNDFNDFIKDDSKYLGYRCGDDILTVNADMNKSLPASCTWFDALAYCSWYAKKYGIPVRLLTSDEYMEIRKDSVGYTPEESIHQDLFYTNPTTGKVYQKHPPYMGEFQSLLLTYREDIPTINLENGLEFLNSNDFSEWMADKTCVRSASLASFYRHGHVARSKPPLDSSGKYKHQKIGFRICYDIS